MNQSSVVVNIPTLASGSPCSSVSPQLTVISQNPQNYTLPIQLQVKPDAIGPNPSQGGSRFNVYQGGTYGINVAGGNCYPAGTTFVFTTNSRYFTIENNNELYIAGNAPKGSLGSAILTATQPNGCTTFRSYNIFNPTTPAPVRLSGATVSMYPNPATSAVTVSAGREGAYLLELSDQYGTTALKQQFTGTETMLNIQGLREGVYSLRLLSKAGCVTKQLVIE
ncbi:T9SS type A sorting domain-containing protein [Hymenobacter elongatus]|uniref:T9SS type A sorting domain-containing protein n=1 Tax=Hymenobacter elongatus TaxID=877208 RepID=A0A4Z0PFE5_9BACT|nr:T9SS type A sorting domain-containing protein [Hymenobacter elongatus]TGE13868.1 T9SS type A sorting domain-containing protein [Hymenobacter elongatus]